MSNNTSRRKFVAEASMMALGAAGLAGCKDTKQAAANPTPAWRSAGVWNGSGGRA